MKVETLILSLLSRAIQVGLIPFQVDYPPTVVEQSCNITCDCDCIWVFEDRWASGAVAGDFAGFFLSGLVAFVFSLRHDKSQPLLSPRRRGRG